MVVIKTNFTIVIVSDRERGEEDEFELPGNLYSISEVLFLKLKKVWNKYSIMLRSDNAK